MLLLALGMASFITAVSGILMTYALDQQQKAQEAARETDEQRAVAQSLLDTVDFIDSGAAFFNAVMRGHTEPVLGVDFSPDQTRIVTATDDGTARVWDISIPHARSAVATLTGHAEAVRSARFSPDGRLIVTASADGTARVWEVVTGRQTALFDNRPGKAAFAVTYAAFSSDGRYVVTGTSSGTVGV